MRIRGLLERGRPFVVAHALQYRAMTVGAEGTAEELAHDGDRAAAVEDELRKARRLIDAPSDADARERRDGVAELAGQHDRPLAFVVSRTRRAFAGHDLDVVYDRLSVDRLTDVDPRLTGGAERSIVQEVTEEARERERSLPLPRGGHVEVERCRAQRPAALIRTDLIDRCFEPHHDAVDAEAKLIRAHPGAVSPKQLVVRGTGQRASVLKGQRHAVARAVRDRRRLARVRKGALAGGRVHGCATHERQIFDPPGHAVGHEHARALGDADGAAVAHEEVAELLEVGREAGLIEVPRHDAGAGSEGRLHVGLHGEPPLDGLLGEEARGDHDRGVRRVRARRDRGDDNGAVDHPAERGREVRDRRGRDRCRRDLRLGRVVDLLRPLGQSGASDPGRRLRTEERAPDHRELDAVLGSLRSGETRTDRREVHLDHLVEGRDRRAIHAEQALRLGVPLHQIDDIAATGDPQIPERLRVDREVRRGGTVLGTHVGHRRAVLHGEQREAVTGELDELVHHTVLPQPFGQGEHEIGRRRSDRRCSVELHTHHDRPGQIGRLAEHRGLRLDAADAPPEDAEPVDHRGVRVGAEERVRHRHAVAQLNDTREPLEVHLVADPRARRDDPEGLEGLAGPAEQ